MGRRRAYTPLNVFMNARRVGRLERDSGGAVAFSYAEEWLAWEHAMPISLSLPLSDRNYRGPAVFAVLDNLLPDGDLIRSRIAARVGADGSDAYSLLARLGRDCVGALQFLEDGGDPGVAGAVAGHPIDRAGIATILRNLAIAPLGVGGDEPEFRISIAGAHEKTALLNLGGEWHVPNGTTATTHILKPQIGLVNDGLDLRQSVENELFSLRICREFGLPTANAWIEDFEDRRVLVVERFDREWSGSRLLRRPQEDFCQATATPPGKKYEADGGPGMRVILELLKASDTAAQDIRAFLKAQILFWLMAAIDGHAKNFSIGLLPGGGFRLTPLYDVLSAWPTTDGAQIPYKKAKLAMAVGKQRHYRLDEIRPYHFEQTCMLAHLPPSIAKDVTEEIGDTAATAMTAAITALPPGYPEELMARIRDGILKEIGTKLGGGQ